MDESALISIISQSVAGALEAGIGKRLDKIETLLEEKMPGLNLMTHKIEDHEKSLNALWKQYRSDRETFISMQGQCPKKDIDGLRKWVWALLAGLIIQFFANRVT